MKIMIPFKNPKTGEIKQVKLGFSWTIGFFGAFGIPFFLRGLNLWGAVFLALWIVDIFFTNTIGPLPLLAINGAWGVMQIWLAFKGNEMAAKNYLERGWVFAEPDSDFTRMAKRRWGISIESASNGEPAHVPNKTQSTPATNDSTVRFCHQCGSSLPATAAFCSNCGAAK